MEEIYQNALRARDVLKGLIHETPLDLSSTFSAMTGGEVYLKLENLQKTGSFKVRGAYYKMWTLGDAAKRGVVAASAGNHAQGVAFAAKLLGVKATIVMPLVAPLSKILATKSYGAEVVLYGNVIDESMKKANEIVEQTGATLIHPYDDPAVIAGQGTISLELLEQMSEPPDVVVIPIGGGGLISGNAVVLKKRLGDKVKVIGVEPSYLPKYSMSLKEGRPVNITGVVSGLMDGLIVKTAGKFTFELIRDLVDDVVTVDDREVARAMFLLLERGKTLAEGAGAAPLAAILEGKVNVKGKRVVALISGGNVDLTRLANIINYELFRTRRLIKLVGTVPDQPGYLDRVLRKLADARFNVIDIRHDRFSPSLVPGYAMVEVLVEAPDPDAVPEALQALKADGFNFREAEG
ncbi:Threonine dehydratase [Acidilobus saccharovorans 345-15]|uniref:threonine ammonia-lyase n=1 Tax=Acidilobus saccharovorans (strain DSM 16705 / JCM 18335 / VKM B-2471 / 345-15) TaxID=666510 RepID=D9Q333_ACIS3|nr:Threonine dehydratase [Acidilobus saccharovorans 345-15]